LDYQVKQTASHAAKLPGISRQLQAHSAEAQQKDHAERVVLLLLF
jgi:hypothetical protein